MTDMEPFIGSAAVRRGDLTRRGLARQHRAVYRDVYLAQDVELTARLRARAAWLSTGATLAGVSAAAVLGTKWLDAGAPAEIVRADRHAPAGIVVHTWALAPGETCNVDGMALTGPARTAFDIGRTRPLREAVPIIDALLHATRTSTEAVSAVAGSHCGSPGSARVRSALELVDGGAESPQESRLRMLVVGAGLPRPETQIEFHQLRIRVDMGWREWKVAVEYDGLQHWSDARQRAWDIERIALLEDAGWTVIRVSSEMLRRPHVVIERIREKLRAAGCPV